MSISLTDSSQTVYFNVYAPGRGPGDEALARSDVTGATVPAINRFKGVLPADGDYRVAVYQVRAAARRGERPGFTMTVSIDDRALQLPGGAAVPSAPPAPANSGFLRVTGLTAGDTLNVRSGPSTGQPVIFTLRNGETVRSRGCQTAPSGTRWCQVHRVGQVNPSGWASARYLAAARDPGVATQLPESPRPGTQLPGDATVPGTGFNARGVLVCAFGGRANVCPWGVVRRGNGNATLIITLPGGTQRVIDFAGGRPETANFPGGVFGEFAGDEVTVSIGTNERYIVPNAVLFGG